MDQFAETPFFALYRTNPIIVYGHSNLLGAYYCAELYSEGMYSLRRDQFEILPQVSTLNLYGRDIHDPLLAFPPFLVAEKATGDIFLAIKSVTEALLRVQTPDRYLAARDRIGRNVTRTRKEIEILPQGFKIQVKQSDISKLSVFRFE